MEKFGKSQPIRRSEDQRFLTGTGRYLDDIAPRGALRAYVFRSPVAHAVLTGLDTAEAEAAPGVHLVLTAASLAAAGITMGMQGVPVGNRDGSASAAPRRPILAEGKLRHLGEPVALVVADTLDQARDAAELIALDYDDLPAKMDLSATGPLIHDDLPDNRGYDWDLGDEAAVEAALAGAAHRLEFQVEDTRAIVASMEPRGCTADWRDGRLHVGFSGQGVWVLKSQLAQALNLSEDQVHTTIPDVGGGFGMKVAPYNEYFAVAQAARALGRPVHWASDRSEAMLSDHHGRDLRHSVTMGFDAAHKLTAYRVHTESNLGAYNSHFGQLIQSRLFSRVFMGVYDLQAAYMRAEGFYTNTTQVDAYRGAGRPEAIYLLERSMDMAARELGVSPWDLRRINFIPRASFPYTTVSDEIYDTGDFHALLDRAHELSQAAGFAARRAETEARGKLRGQGLAYYIESILGDPSEGARVEFHEDGTVSIYVGTQSNGQGHETVYAKFLSDQTGIPMAAIRVVQGDSDKIAQGGGTGGSRSVTTQGTATLATVDKMIAAFTPFLADQMGVAPEEVDFDAERFRAPGSNLTPTLLEAAAMARAAGREDLLTHQERATLPGRSFPNGAHVAEVEIDPETGKVDLVAYLAVDDFGNLINPLLAEGQVHGGVAQGAGQILMEQAVYDEDGQLLSGSFMDYAMPRAADLPMIGFHSLPVPSTANLMGMKGCGEAGTVGAMGAVANAVMDALSTRGITRADMPFTPSRVWQMLQEAG